MEGRSGSLGIGEPRQLELAAVTLPNIDGSGTVTQATIQTKDAVHYSCTITRQNTEFATNSESRPMSVRESLRISRTCHDMG